jgi:hypothetical protein
MSKNYEEFSQNLTQNKSFLSDAAISFLQVPYALFKLKTESGFSHTESYLAIWLFSVSHWKGSFQFTKSYSQIAKESGLSKRKVIDCISKMTAHGVLSVEMHLNKQNVYKWNEGFLKFSGANGSPREVKTVHLGGENGSPREVKTVHHIYIVFFKELIKDSHKEFFSEIGAGYQVRVPPKKKKKVAQDCAGSQETKKVALDSASLPIQSTTRFISRSDAWNEAVESLLSKKGCDVWVNAYIALKTKFDPYSVLFPKRFLAALHCDKATHWEFKKSQGFPLHLESDATFFEYLKTDKEFINFQKKRGH